MASWAIRSRPQLQSMAVGSLFLITILRSHDRQHIRRRIAACMPERLAAVAEAERLMRGADS